MVNVCGVGPSRPSISSRRRPSSSDGTWPASTHQSASDGVIKSSILRLMSIALRFLPPLLAIALMGQTPEPGFTSLWNGKDFTDWKVANPATFTIKDGAMVANGSQGHAFYDGPFRNHTFRNFELKVDVMTKPGSNGGVFILTEFQEKGWPSKGFEIQVNNTFKNDPVRTGSLYHVMDTKEAPAKDDEWFTEHIIVNGDTITVRVNDKQIIEWKATPENPATKRLAPGTIALQAHDPGSTVLYRNIRIKPLD